MRLRQAQVRLTPLEPDPGSKELVRTSDTSAAVNFDSLTPGRYRLRVLYLGLRRDEDTVTIAPGSSDTATATLFGGIGATYNDYNCRPHHFRAPGESACIREGWQVDNAIDFLRRSADSGWDKEMHIPPYRSSSVRLVTDEPSCRSAGWAFDSTSPPRRVIVIRAGQAYYVIDPEEPLHAGEFEITCFYDARWRPLGCLAG